MGRFELEQRINAGVSALAESQKIMQEAMRGAYEELDKCIAESPDILSTWNKRVGESIIIHPGSRIEPAIGLLPDGSFQYTQFGLSLAPSPSDPPLEGKRFIEVAATTLTLLQQKPQRGD